MFTLNITQSNNVLFEYNLLEILLEEIRIDSL